MSRIDEKKQNQKPIAELSTYYIPTTSIKKLKCKFMAMGMLTVVKMIGGVRCRELNRYQVDLPYWQTDTNYT